jgi:hypothetical protein
MPKCKNDIKSSYVGDEPSPKGLGYCAHSEKNGKIMIGNDGNRWIIKKMENGIKKWIKYKIVLKRKNIKKLDDIDLLDNFKLLLQEKKMNGRELLRIYSDTTEEINSRKLVDLSKMIDNKIQSTKKLGKYEINVTGKIIIIDPSYTYDLKSNLILKVKLGKWKVYYNSWITLTRPNNLILVHDKYIDNNKIVYTYSKNLINVDIAQLSVMNYSDYPKYKYGEDQFNWYEENIASHSEEKYKKINNGYVINTGYGDGSYPYAIGKINNEIVKIIVYFIW